MSNLPEAEIVKIYHLKKPFKDGDAMVTKLEWIEPLAKHHIDVSNEKTSDVEKMAYFMSLLTNQPMRVIGKLRQVDFIECQKILADFLVEGHQTS